MSALSGICDDLVGRNSVIFLCGGGGGEWLMDVGGSSFNYDIPR